MSSSTIKSLAATTLVVFTLTLAPVAAARPQSGPSQRATTSARRSDVQERIMTAARRILTRFFGPSTNAEPAIPLPGQATANAEPAIPLPIDWN